MGSFRRGGESAMILNAFSTTAGDRAKTPTVSSASDTEYIPTVEMAPIEVLRPYTPQTPAGCLVEPPVSVPMVKSSQGYAADAAAEPALEDDGDWYPSPRGLKGGT